MLSEKDLQAILEENIKLKKLIKKQEMSISENMAILSEKNAILVKQEAEFAKQEAEIAQLKSLIERLQRMVYGQKKERFVSGENQLNLFEPIPVQKQEELEEKALEQIEITYKKEKKAHPGRTKLPENLEVVETTLEPEGDLSEMKYIGDEVTEELGYQPEKFFLHRIIRKKYAPKPSEGSIMIAKLPNRIINKGIPSDALLIQILIYKYIDHLPLYRIRQRFARSGIFIPEATMDGWVKTCMERLQILYDYQASLLKQSHYLQVDETTLKVQDSTLKGKTHLGYYWVYHSPIDQQVLFEYHPSREGKHVWQSLKDFKGYLQTDGYAGYAAIAAREDITHVACMAHIRRKFIEAESNDSKRAQRALIYIQSLYLLERQFKEENLAADQIKEKRLEKSLPILNEMSKWVAEENKKLLPKSAIGKAFNYAIQRWDEMCNYLHDGNIQIDNNLIENAIRPIAIGRKNYLFAGSHEAAGRSAMIYTFFANCKRHNVDPAQWLKQVLPNILDMKVNQVKTLLPSNFNTNQ